MEVSICTSACRRFVMRSKQRAARLDGLAAHRLAATFLLLPTAAAVPVELAHVVQHAAPGAEAQACAIAARNRRSLVMRDADAAATVEVAQMSDVGAASWSLAHGAVAGRRAIHPQLSRLQLSSGGHGSRVTVSGGHSSRLTSRPLSLLAVHFCSRIVPTREVTGIQQGWASLAAQVASVTALRLMPGTADARGKGRHR